MNSPADPAPPPNLDPLRIGTTDSVRPAAVLLSLLFVLPLYVNLFQVSRSSYADEKLSSAVNQALGPLALVLGLMGAVLQ